MKYRRLFIIIFLSIIIHELVHGLQILLLPELTYKGWGIGILEGYRPYGFYWEVDYPGPVLSILNIYEVQAYGTQILFLLVVVWKKITTRKLY